jgi:hypothetical protein
MIRVKRLIGHTKQTDEPWKDYPEKEQRNDTDIDLEKWQESGTH